MFKGPFITSPTCGEARLRVSEACLEQVGTASLRTKILDFRRFDSSRILMLRGGILLSKGNSPEDLSQAILAGIILVGRLGVIGKDGFPGNYLEVLGKSDPG